MTETDQANELVVIFIYMLCTYIVNCQYLNAIYGHDWKQKPRINREKKINIVWVSNRFCANIEDSLSELQWIIYRNCAIPSELTVMWMENLTVKLNSDSFAYSNNGYAVTISVVILSMYIKNHTIIQHDLILFIQDYSEWESTNRSARGNTYIIVLCPNN